MGLLEGMQQGVNIARGMNQNVADAANARYAYPMTRAQMSILQSNAQYAPLLAAAQINSQNSYARNLPLQIAAQIYSNPNMAGLLADSPNGKAALQAIIDAAAQQVGGQAGNYNAGMPTGSGLRSGGLAAGNAMPTGSINAPAPMGNGYDSRGNPIIAPGPANSYANQKMSEDEVDWIAYHGNQMPMPPGYKAGMQGKLPNQAGGIAAPMPVQPVAPGQRTDINQIAGIDPNSEYGQAVTAWNNSPEKRAIEQKQGYATANPPPEQLLPWYRQAVQDGKVERSVGTGFQSNTPKGSSVQRFTQQSQARTSGDVMTGGEGKGPGTTYTVPPGQEGAGETRSSLTSTAASQAQTSILASQKIAPVLNDLVEGYKGFYGAPAGAKMIKEGVTSWLSGGKFRTPTIAKLGKYNYALVTIADAMMKELNLNNTTGNRTAMEEGIKPILGENPKDYENRINFIKESMAARDEASKKALAVGIVLNPAPIKDEADLNARIAAGQKAIDNGTAPKNIQGYDEKKAQEYTDPTKYGLTKANKYDLKPKGEMSITTGDGKTMTKKVYSQADLEHTAKIHKMTVEQVKAALEQEGA